jgi:hypothetical protein
MSKLFAGNSWYYSKYSSSFYESHYENRIIANAEVLFPNYFCLKFKLDVTSDDYGGPSRPDLVLIDKQYRYWYVVEVELDNDKISAVENQVKIFTSGKYGDLHAVYVHQKSPDLDLSKLKKLMSTQPEVVVLLPRVKPSWSNKLAQYGTKFMVVEIFENSQKVEIFRVDGDELREEDDQLVTNLTYNSSYSRALTIQSPGNLDPEKRVLTVLVEKQLTNWKIVNYGSSHLLLGQGTLPLDLKPGSTFRLLEQPDGLLVMETD